MFVCLMLCDATDTSLPRLSTQKTLWTAFAFALLTFCVLARTCVCVYVCVCVFVVLETIIGVLQDKLEQAQAPAQEGKS